MLAGMAKNNPTFGLTLSNRALVTRGMAPEELIDMAVKAEATGLIDAIWVGDSILSKPRLECIPLLGAIASRTSRVKLGVACMATIAQRNPVLLALHGQASTRYRAAARGSRHVWVTRRLNIRWRPRSLR